MTNHHVKEVQCVDPQEELILLGPLSQ